MKLPSIYARFMKSVQKALAIKFVAFLILEEALYAFQLSTLNNGYVKIQQTGLIKYQLVQFINPFIFNP